MTWQSVEVTEADILNAEYLLNSEQMILRILKDKGVPMRGTIYLTQDDSYEYKHKFDTMTGLRVMYYRKKDFTSEP